MNSHLIGSSPRTTLGHITKDSSYCYDEIDERLFDSYLDISGNDSSNNNNNIDKTSTLFSRISLSSSSYSSPTLSEEDSDSSSSPKSSVIGTGRKVNKRSILNKRSNEAKLVLKKEESDSESDSQSDHSIKSTTKKSKSKKANAISSNNNNNEADKKQKNLYKTELCRNWEETGHCRYGVKCQYAHGSRDLREVERHPKYKTQKCRTFHQTGSCPYGARCTFRHYDLPGDALEMKNLAKAEQKQQQAEEEDEEEDDMTVTKEVNIAKEAEKQQKIEFTEEEESSIHDDLSDSSNSIFSPKNQKMLHQNWFGSNNTNARLNGASPLVVGLGEGSIPRRNMMMNQLSSSLFDLEDSLLPSNAESLLPHELLFDLESPEEDKKPARCPLRDYVTLPNFSNFQMPQQPETEDSASLCKSLFRPWLF